MNSFIWLLLCFIFTCAKIGTHGEEETVPTVYVNPCSPSPCGPNSQCREVQEQAVCSCLPTYIGSPPGCRPECVVSSECHLNEACSNQKCIDPCPGTCGSSAICNVINHIPMCSCPVGMSGNAFVECRPFQTPIITKPCQPSPCGQNSQCREINEQAVCSCVPGYIGSPPNCRPECVTSSECGQNQACSNQKCIDPCPGTCGIGAKCLVVNQNPICTCPSRYTGDPFIRCQPIPERPLDMPIGNPCQPSPCGPNAECRVNGESYSCICVRDYVGSPPNCRPECVSNSECPSNLACINLKCKDPCDGACGLNSECRVVSHTPMCICLSGYTGDPFSQCTIKQMTPIDHSRPCDPSPCGSNAICREQNGAGSCSCLPDFIGNPYEGCRPECVLNSDCPSNRACIRSKCGDPCPGTCGQNADCQVVNHLPSCTCRPGYKGDPFRYCNVQRDEHIHIINETSYRVIKSNDNSSVAESKCRKFGSDLPKDISDDNEVLGKVCKFHDVKRFYGKTNTKSGVFTPKATGGGFDFAETTEDADAYTICVSSEKEFYSSKQGIICNHILELSDIKKSLPDGSGCKHIFLFSNNNITFP